jgi:hypothetical protein
LKKYHFPADAIYLFSKIKNQEINSTIYISVVDFTWLEKELFRRSKKRPDFSILIDLEQ